MTLSYYDKVRNGRHFNISTEILILKFLIAIRDKGLDEFYKIAKDSKTKEEYKLYGMRKEINT